MDGMNKREINLGTRQLQLLLTVLEEGTITRAADKLGISQSAVSHALEKLRDELGDPLFVRAGRSIVATDYARRIKPNIEQALQLLEGITAAHSLEPGRYASEIVIAANDYSRDLLLPGVLASLRQQAPQASLRIVDCPPQPSILLRQNAALLALSLHPAIPTDIISEPLLTLQQGLFYDPHCRPPATTAAEILDAEFVATALQTDNPNHRLTLPLPGDPAIKPTLVVQSPTAAAAFVRNSARLALLPIGLCQSVIQGLSLLPLGANAEPLQLHMCWHNQLQQSPLGQWLRNIVREVARKQARVGMESGDGIGSVVEVGPSNGVEPDDPERIATGVKVTAAPP